MSLHTKVFDVQDAIVTALQAAAGLSGWTVCFGLPVRRDELHVWVDEQVSQWKQDQQTTGTQSKLENFQLHAYVYVRHSGATAQEIRDEAKAAGAIVEQTIGGSPILGGLALMAEISGGEYDGAFADPEGRAREGALHLVIDVQTFIA